MVLLNFAKNSYKWCPQSVESKIVVETVNDHHTEIYLVNYIGSGYSGHSCPNEVPNSLYDVIFRRTVHPS